MLGILINVLFNLDVITWRTVVPFVNIYSHEAIKSYSARLNKKHEQA